MNRQIIVDLADLGALARTLDGLGQQAEALKVNAASAVRPAERSDVPELAVIEACSLSLRAAIAKLATDLASQTAALRAYAASLLSVETLIEQYRTHLYMDAFGPMAANPFGFAATAGMPGEMSPEDITEEQRKDLAELGFAVAADRLPGLPMTDVAGVGERISLTEGVGAFGAASIMFKSVALPVTLFLDYKHFTNPDATMADKIYAGADGSVAVIGAGGTVMSVMGAGAAEGSLAAAGAAATGVAEFAAPVLIAYAGGSYLEAGFEADDAAGRSSMVRIRNQFATNSLFVGAPAAASLATLEVTTLGVHKGALAIARQVYPEAPSNEIDGQTAAVLTAAIQQAHPGASLSVVDGSVWIRIPSGHNTDIVHLDNNLDIL